MAGNNKSGNNNNSGGGGGRAKKQKKSKRGNGGGGGTGPPTAIGTGVIAQSPRIVGGTQKVASFSNTEYVTDVSALAIGATTGAIQSVTLNPANSVLCPWLSRIAAGYELYRFRRLSMIYTPTCSSTTAGMVVMAYDYDATDAPPTTKQTLSGYEGAVRGNVWNRQTSNFVPTANWYYTGLTSTTSGPPGTDQKFYDCGKFLFGVFNQTASGPVGELSVSYTVEFAKPEYTIPYGLSEKIVTTGSTISLLTGTATEISGNPVFSVSPAGSGKLKLTATVSGEFLINVVSTYTTSAVMSVPNIFFDVTQQDSNGSAGLDTPWSDYVISANIAGSNGAYMGAIVLQASPGVVFTFTLVNAITAASLIRMRVASYRRILG